MVVNEPVSYFYRRSNTVLLAVLVTLGVVLLLTVVLVVIYRKYKANKHLQVPTEDPEKKTEEAVGE